MNRYCILWLSVISSSLYWPVIPSLTFIACTILIVFALFWYSKLSAIVLIAALLWVTFHISDYRSWQSLIASKEIHQISFRIVAKKTQSNYIKLKVRVLAFGAQKIYINAPYLSLNLSTRVDDLNDRSPELQIGDIKAAWVRLKPAYGLSNPLGFNKSKWLVAQSIVGSGSIKVWSRSRVAGLTRSRSSAMRSKLREAMEHKLEISQQYAAMLALVSADRSSMSTEQNRVLQQSGLSHLFVVSGLHIGLLAGVSWFGLNLLLFRANSGLKCLLVIGICAAYCWFIAWPISALRAFLVLSLLLIAKAMNFRLSGSQVVLLSASLITLIWPLSVYSLGFWLSFSAFAIVLASVWFWRFAAWRQLIAIQSSITFGMLPLQLAVFSYFPALGLVLNLVFIPLFSLILVPLIILTCLCSAFYQPLFHILLRLCDELLGRSFKLLFYLEQHLDFGVEVAPAHSLVLLVLLMLVFSVVFYQRNYFYLWGLGIVVGLLIFDLRSTFNKPQWTVLIFDVGQGSAVLVEHQQKYLLYDTGAKFRGGYSYAQQVILPFLNAKAVSQLDWLVVSHKDNDHAGGIDDLSRELSIVHHVLPKSYASIASNRDCKGRIQWGELVLEFASALEIAPKSQATNPGGGWLDKSNNQSCTLRVASAQHSVYFSGDIEKEAEQFLLENNQVKASTVLLSPHHGSDSSSSEPFVNTVSAEQVVHSAGSYNRYNFPHPQVELSYHLAKQWTVGEDGAVSINFYEMEYEISALRQLLVTPWYLRLTALEY